MNTKRLTLAIVVAFVVLWATDFLIHGVWMTPDYRATQQLWRTDAEMQSHMAWMLGAQLLFVITFVILWAKGFASPTAKVGCAVGYGLLMGLFSGVWASSCTLSCQCLAQLRRNGSLLALRKQSCSVSLPFSFTSQRLLELNSD